MLERLRIAAFVLPLAAGGALSAQESAAPDTATAPPEQAVQPAPHQDHDEAVRRLRRPGKEDPAPYGTMKANPSQTGVQPGPSPREEQELRRQEQQQRQGQERREQPLPQHPLDGDE